MGTLECSSVATGAREEEKSEAGMPSEVIPVLHKLAGKWPDVLDALDVAWKPLKGAMTNHIYECQWPGGVDGKTPRKALVRIYGDSSDILFRREDEVRIFEFVSKTGQGARLLGRFPNGRVEEFIHARTLSAGDLRDEKISGKIASRMREFHGLRLPGSSEPMLWNRLRDWLEKALKLSAPQPIPGFNLQIWGAEIDELQKQISRPADTVGFCHNDLQYGNIMLDDDTGSLTLIDYEYASYNPVAFDIANHFCEMAANYHTDSPHRLNFDLYPGFDERRRFVNTYLSSSAAPPSEEDVEKLLGAVDNYELASHLHWGLWGIISAAISDIDFDYLEYARQRFQRYEERKRGLLPPTKSKCR